jgi:myo-inositol-1-phosphate synthase
VALVGIGNCAAALVQGLHHYRHAAAGDPIPGLMHPVLGGYAIGDIAVSAAFDVAQAKVGLDLSAAIGAAPNNTHRFAEVPELGVPVRRGPSLDGLGRYLQPMIRESDAPIVDVAAILRETGTEVVVNYLPVGAERATEFYMEQAIRAGCAVVNCIPVFIAGRPAWRDRFTAAGLPLIGDDIKSQVGATIVHRALARLFRDRGVRLDHTYQLNFGGNADFLNMLERERLESKKISKTGSVVSQMGSPLSAEDAHVGPSDFVPWLTDRKWAYIRLEGTGFGGVPLAVELKLEVWDSPNSAGVVIDAIRCARLALDRGIGGVLAGPSAWFMKSPPVQMGDGEAMAATEAFIADTPAEDMGAGGSALGGGTGA